MFRYVKLKNYKSLVDLEVDLTGKGNKPKKLVLIYGENGIGKSNFVSCFYTLAETLRTMSIKENLQKLLEKNNIIVDNSNTDRAIREHLVDTDTIIKKYKTLDSSEKMMLEFGFEVEGKLGSYTLEFDDTKIVSEKLKFVHNTRTVSFFDITQEEVNISKSIFKKADYEIELCEIVDKYWGKHSLLSILTHEIEDKKEGYVEERICDGLYEALSFLTGMSIKLSASFTHEKGQCCSNHSILMELDAGEIEVSSKKELDWAEKMLNDFFTSLYSDVKKVYFDKKNVDNKIRYQLYFKKLISEKVIDISFADESAGTQHLLRLLSFIITCVESNHTVIIDEVDTGIHDLLISSLFENLYDDIKGQFIATTHNTLLLEADFAKDSAYIFVADRLANKMLLPLSTFEKRIHPNLNMRKRYLSGLYGGVPMSMDVDFSSLIEDSN